MNPCRSRSRSGATVRRLGHADFHELAVEVLDRSRGIVFRAHGRSMRPFIDDGDIVCVETVETAAVRVGDIVLFRGGGGELLAHRVVRMRSRDGVPVWTTRGDALLGDDADSGPTQLLGRVSHRIHQGRSLRLDGGWRRWAGLLWARLLWVRRGLWRLRILRRSAG